MDEDTPGKPSIMRPIPTSASIATPLIRSYLWLGTEAVTLGSLVAQHEQTRAEDAYAWRLSEGLQESELGWVGQLFGVEDAFTIPRIRTTTVVYGYRSGISSYPTQIRDDERLPQLFKEPRGGRYRAYFADTLGRALVVRLARQRLLEALVAQSVVNPSESYEKCADATLQFASAGNFQEVIEGRGPVALLELVHAIEHAFFKTAVNHVGLEVFGGKILLRDAAVVLYEREDVGPGGLVQLSNTSEFLRLLKDSRQVLWSCPQLCRGSCPACLFVHDYYCQPYMPNEIDRWLPPNSLLNRVRARELMRRTMVAAVG